MDLEKILHQGQENLLLGQQFNQQQTSNYQLKNVSLQIASTYHTINYNDCLFEIYEDCICLTVNEDKVISVLFSNISSIGIADINLLLFLQGIQQSDSEQVDEQLPKPMPQLFKLIKQHDKGSFSLTGNYTISLSFKQYNNQVKNQVHQILIGYLKSQEQQQPEDFMSEMISAEQINQDGTINKINHQHSQQDSNSQDSQNN